MESQNLLPFMEIECKHLPSRGLPYPIDSVLKYRTYTHGEVRQVSVSKPTIATLLQNILAGVKSDTVDINKLTIIDAFYIGILRKVSTLNGMQFELPFECESCGHKSKEIYSEKDIEFNDISSDVTALPIRVKLNGKECKFSPLTVKAFLDLESGRYSKFVKNSKANATAVEALQIENLEFKDAYDLLFNLTSHDDIADLEDVDKLLKHDLKPLIAICSNTLEDGSVCSFKNELRIEGRDALIMPFRGTQGLNRDRIRFGAE